MGTLTLENREVYFKSLNPRTEKHGPDEVPVLDIGIQFDATNEILDSFGSKLKESLYHKSKSKKLEPELDGVEPVSDLPNLKNPEISDAIKVGFSSIGYRFEILEGIDDHPIVELTDVKVNEVKCLCKEGGTVEVSLRLQVAKIDPHEITGLVHGILKDSRPINLTPPSQEELAAMEQSSENDE